MVTVKEQIVALRQQLEEANRLKALAENAKAQAEEQLKKSSEAALKGAETQAESQRKLANDIKGQLVTAKEDRKSVV